MTAKRMTADARRPNDAKPRLQDCTTYPERAGDLHRNEIRITLREGRGAPSFVETPVGEAGRRAKGAGLVAYGWGREND